MAGRPIISLLVVALLSINLHAGQQAPDFTLRNLNGERFKLSENLKRGPLLIDFWATWCKPCLQELEVLEKINRQFDEAGVKVVAISIDNPRSLAKVKPFIKGSGYTFEVLLDRDMEVRQLFGGTAVPMTILIDTTGAIAYQHTGYVPGDENELLEAVKRLLNTSPEKVMEPAQEDAD